jgi:hypothetical protein
LQPQDVQLALNIFIALAAAIGIVLSAMRWADRKLEKRIVTEIQQSTRQIQPTTNGGASLRDLHNKMDTLIVDVKLLKTSVVGLEDNVQRLEDEVETMR